MTTTLTTAEKLQRLHWNTALNAANSVFGQLTFFGPAWVLFLSELQFSNTQIGFLLSLLPFTGLVALVAAPAVSRFGYKRSFVTFFGIRKLLTAGLLLVPWLLTQTNISVVLVYVTVIVAGFALARAISETAMYPWQQEFIPNSIRGRYAAVNDIAARLTGILSVAVASFILGLSDGIDRFMLLFAIGVAFGVIAVWFATHIPGGAPPEDATASKTSYHDLRRVLHDRNFLFYVGGLGLLTIGVTPFSSFLPLFLQEQVGLPDSRIVLLQIGTLVGGLFSTYLVGWATDRYGSKPLMMLGLYVKILVPVAWLLTPRSSDLSLPFVLLVALIAGSTDIAWAIGSARLLFVKVVPAEKRSEYMAVYYASMGLIGGLAQVFGGQLLDFTQGLSGQFLIFEVDPFFPLFVLGFVLTAISAFLFHRVQADSPMSMGEFAGLFVHGNPVLALESLFRYYRARDERETVVMTERLGMTKSLLTVDELLEALKDPRFNVRFEAIISIARMERDPRLTDAVVQILDGTEISLAVIAAWALGRIGDERAVEALRAGLNAPYRSIQAHCVRSLGTLRDVESAPLILSRLQSETDKGLRVAYSSALGNMRYTPATQTLLEVLAQTENEGARRELALALARITGDEHYFIRLLRNVRQDKGTALARALTAIGKLYRRRGEELAGAIRACADVFARDNFVEGSRLLAQVIALMPVDSYPAHMSLILRECAAQLEAQNGEREEYLLLALHVLDAAAP